MDPTRGHDHEQHRALVERLATVGFVMPGTLLHTRRRCGRPTCRCATGLEQGHGPYHQWTRKIGGKTRTLRLTDEQAEIYGPWFDHAKQLRALIADLEHLGRSIFERNETS